MLALTGVGVMRLRHVLLCLWVMLVTGCGTTNQVDFRQSPSAGDGQTARQPDALISGARAAASVNRSGRKLALFL